MKDPYVLEDGTLKNLLGITNYHELKQAETDIAYINLISAQTAVKGKCDVEILKNIHKHIFQDIFTWAGEFRTVPLYKEEVVIPGLSLEYALPKNIEKELSICFDELNSCVWDNKKIDEIAMQLTKQLAKIWRVHPFRDGNTRATLTFGQILAKQHGFDLDLGVLLDDLNRQYDNNGKVIRYSLRDKFVLAALDEKDYPEPEYLQAIIKRSLHTGINKQIDKLNNILNINEER